MRLGQILLNLVNNAITHGIETPDTREASNKQSEGTITVRAFYQGNQTVIYVEGHCIEPNVLPDGVKPGVIGTAKLDGDDTEYEFHFVPAIAAVGFDEAAILGQKIRGHLIATNHYGSSA